MCVYVCVHMYVYIYVFVFISTLTFYNIENANQLVPFVSRDLLYNDINNGMVYLHAIVRHSNYMYFRNAEHGIE